MAEADLVFSTCGEFPIVQEQNQSLLRNLVQVLWTPTALQPFDSV